MKNSKLSLQEIWRLGCSNECLTPDDQKRFAAMARSRFHTFEMGINHAENDKGRALGLIRGLAVELNENPGLAQVWQRMAISDTEPGQMVCLQLEKLQTTSH